MDIQKLIRPNILELKAYSSARSEYTGNKGIFLDANENSLGSTAGIGLNRYPDPLATALKKKISELKKIPQENIFLGNGSDEAIDLLFRIFCEPRKSNVILCPPTYGMYEVSANINNTQIKNVPLSPEFQLRVKRILNSADKNTKLLFICSPNNPTANLMRKADVKELLKSFNGIVALDEAYIDFADDDGFLDELQNYPNLVILQTFSKAWGAANIRLGMAFASKEIIDYFNKVKPPYNISGVTQKLALKALKNKEKKDKMVQEILFEREKLKIHLKTIGYVEKIFHSDANFLLIKVKSPNHVYNHLVKHNIIVRNRSNVAMCEGCLRITIGTKQENERLIKCLESFNPLMY